ncbi:MAG: hypothetical protein LLG14_19530 [Nocardiaceae bacterium]|nr:hypothetical protein [Nocardiaceae bacterium]
MRLSFSPQYIQSAYGFDTTRKAGWVAESLQGTPIAGVELVAPAPLTVGDVALVHSPEYVDALRTGTPLPLAESMGFDWDPGVWPMVAASNGGVLAAARAALQDGVAGSLSSGLHHAKYDMGDGFCAINGLAVTAKQLLAEGAVSSVLIIDVDAHFGGGTAQLIADDPRIAHVDVSVDPFDCYGGYPNSSLYEVLDSDDYLPTIEAALAGADGVRGFDLCLLNAGVDPHQNCDNGGMTGIDATTLASREALIFEYLAGRGIPAAFVLAGGYVGSELSRSALVGLHRITISRAAKSLC